MLSNKYFSRYDILKIYINEKFKLIFFSMILSRMILSRMILSIYVCLSMQIQENVFHFHLAQFFLFQIA